MSEAAFVPAIAVDAVAPGNVVKVILAGREILVCNSQDRLFALENKCSHADEPLECGRIRNGWIACPAHGARFDLDSGQAMNPPAKDPIVTFPVRVADGMIEIAIG